MRITRAQITAILLIGGPLAGCRPAHTAGPKPTDLVDLMVAHYARLATYHDRGASVDWTARDDASELTIESTEFETHFQRAPTPQTRFAFRDMMADQETVLVSRGAEIRIYDHGYEVKSVDSVADAEMRLRGASGGTVDIVPSMLRGENPWTCNGEKPKRCDLAGDDWVGNVRCTRVVIHRPPCGDVFVCIDANLMLRKTSDWWRASVERQRKSLEDFIESHPDHKAVLEPRLRAMSSPTTDENTVLFFPQANAPIAPDAFAAPASEPEPPSQAQPDTL